MIQVFAHAFQSRLAYRLAASFAAMCAAMVALSALGGWLLWQQDRSFASLLDTTVPQLTALRSLGTEVDEVSLAARDAMLATDPEAAQKALERIELGRSRIGQEIEQIQATCRQGGQQGQELAEQLGTHSSGILVTLVKFSRLHKAGKLEQARALFNRDMQTRMQDLSNTIKKGQEIELQTLARQKAASRQRLQTALGWGAGLLMLVMLASVALTWGITRSVTVPVQQAVALAQRVARGDLTSDLQVTRRDEFGELQMAMAQMQARLSELVQGILGTVRSIEATGLDIAQGNHDLSERTERAGETLHRTSEAMEELASTFMQSADSARNANALVGQTSDGVARSGEVVSQVVSNMQEISTSSAKISDIIGVIDGIAFQTNILALNAAVEAARAGEQGRGFAVVAQEVRALAQRSANAAREIKTLIQASVERVQAGSDLVGEAGQTMQALIAQVGQVNELINTISAVAAQQTSGVQQVNASVMELEQATQRNAGLVHQTSDAAHTLRAETGKLAEAVGVFKLR
ncbi:MAG: hypothetical protein RI907_1284 [Pseudomonadota bacterium]|jgi:methyl-accepting chemotaxis protein